MNVTYSPTAAKSYLELSEEDRAAHLHVIEMIKEANDYEDLRRIFIENSIDIVTSHEENLILDKISMLYVIRSNKFYVLDVIKIGSAENFDSLMRRMNKAEAQASSFSSIASGVAAGAAVGTLVPMFSTMGGVLLGPIGIIAGGLLGYAASRFAEKDRSINENSSPIDRVILSDEPVDFKEKTS